MRISLTLLALAALTPIATAADLRFFNDAALHAVQFMPDGQEGWAVGDEGVIWHTIDGGKLWERQPSGTRASLKSLHFLDPAVGFVVGREELPLGHGSAGVILVTLDGGERWTRLSMNELPGLNFVRFVSEKVGFAGGDGTDQYPTGLFITRDSGKSWKPVPGPRYPGWSAGTFTDADTGTVVGAWSRLAGVRRGQVAPLVMDWLGGRNVRGLYTMAGKDGRSIGVGQGGLVLFSDDGGAKWATLKMMLPDEVIACWDFHTVHGAGKHVWAAGRPGSALLHSPDGGKNWELQRTGQPLPINGLHFRDEKTGWAVGEMGLILNTSDGGRTWRAQQQGGHRAAILNVNAKMTGLCADTVAKLADEGYLSTALRVVTPDPTSAPMRKSTEGDRLIAAMRLAGGASAESVWQFPLPVHLRREKHEAIVEHWDDMHEGKAAEQMLRQLVLALRIWRPDVILCDPPEGKNPDMILESLMAEAMQEAFKQAGDPKAFPEQLGQLGLKPWKPSKLYAPTAENTPGAVIVNLNDVKARFEGSARDFATPAASLLASETVVLPRRRAFKLLASTIAGAEKHGALMEGIPPSATGDSRRALPSVEPLSADLLKGLQQFANFQAMIEKPSSQLTNPERMLGSIGPMLEKLPDARGAIAAHAFAAQMARVGQWFLARELYMQMIEQYPTHPLTADAYRWLIRHNASSETRRRHELGQFLIVGEVRNTPPSAIKMEVPVREKDKLNKKGEPDDRKTSVKLEGSTQGWDVKRELVMVHDREALLKWHRGALDIEKHLVGFGDLMSKDPGLQFALHAARRNMGDFDAPRKWFAEFVGAQPDGPWRDAARAELWLSQRQGTPPKPFMLCKQTETRPFLDGKFDDACWRDSQPVALSDSLSKTAKQAPTKVMLSHDADFLYLAVRCEHPAGKRIAPVKGRKRDEDLRAFDRVSLVLDLDRDYATAFHFQVDQRGCVRESCWGDQSWDPQWFVAVHSDDTSWQVEAAIPLISMTGEILTSGRAWCCNVIRALPGQGVQAMSLPAGVPEDDPRLEGMGLLLFKADPRYEAKRPQPAARMQRVEEE
jgi:photosystem II stability/assembly factor-like uncharacterized protein